MTFITNHFYYLKYRFAIVPLAIAIISALQCSTENPVKPANIDIKNLEGVWKTEDHAEPLSLSGSWIPNNLHIKASGNTLRIRSLDPIACTDAKVIINSSTIKYEQYGLQIQVTFKSVEDGVLSVYKNDSSFSFVLHKTDMIPFWDPCD